MTKQYILAMAVIAAFVAGTIATATPVFAPPPEDDGEGGWKAAVAEQQAQIEEQQAQIEEQQAQIDDLKANEILGFYEVVGDSVVIPAQSSLGGVAVCDDEDIAISGGWNRNNGDMRVNTSLANSINNWGFLFENIDDTNSAEVTPVALCADFDPQHENSD